MVRGMVALSIAGGPNPGRWPPDPLLGMLWARAKAVAVMMLCSRSDKGLMGAQNPCDGARSVSRYSQSPTKGSLDQDEHSLLNPKKAALREETAARRPRRLHAPVVFA